MSFYTSDTNHWKTGRKAVKTGAQRLHPIRHKYCRIWNLKLVLSKISGTVPEMSTQTPNQTFCDWITVKQKHPLHTPFYGGITQYQDAETGVITQTYQFKTVKGLHESSVQIRSDGETVEFSGNISRYNQPNNVQGIDLDECKSKLNSLMASFGLPQFTEGEILRQITASGIEIKYTGARFTRIDITQNLQAGTARRRDIYLQWIQTQNYPKLRKTLIGLNTYFGKETESRTFRIYDKFKEMTDKNKKAPAELNRKGAIRFELEYRKILKTRGTNRWNNATQKALYKQFIKDIQPMHKKIETLDITELPKKVVGTYAMYLQGLNPRDHMSRNIYFEHKRILLRYGVDISNTVTRLIPKKEVIELEQYDSDENQLDLLEG